MAISPVTDKIPPFFFAPAYASGFLTLNALSTEAKEELKVC